MERYPRVFLVTQVELPLFKALKAMISKTHPELSGNDEHSFTWIEITNEIHEGY